MSARIGRTASVFVVCVVVLLGSTTPVLGVTVGDPVSTAATGTAGLHTAAGVESPVEQSAVAGTATDVAGGDRDRSQPLASPTSDSRLCSLGDASLTDATATALAARIQECEDEDDDDNEDDEEDREATVAGEATGGSVATTGTEYEPSYEIEFWSGSYTPEPGLSEEVVARASDTDGPVWTLLQYEAEPSPEQWQAALDVGVEFGEWLADVSYYAAVPAGSLEELAEMDGVRAIAPIRSEWRSHPDFAEELAGTDGELTVTVRAMSDMEVAGLQPIDDEHYRGTVPVETARSLQNDPRVAWLETYRAPRTFLDQGPQVVGAPQARSNPDFAGDLNGDSVTVGVIDSMIDPTHAHFDDIQMTQARIFGPQSRNASLCSSHGMHVAGTIAGTDHGGWVGVAPNASIVWSRILGTGQLTPDSCSWNNVFVGAQGAYDSILDENGDTAIISNSWGFGLGGRYVTPSRGTDQWARQHRDVLVVHSNGNNLNWVGVPANAKNTLSVGSVRDGSVGFTENFTTVPTVGDSSPLNGDRGTRDNENRGSGRLKPEVYAPGEWVVAPGQDASGNDTYRPLLGTSMATPHVSGVAALYRQAHTDASAPEMRAALVATAMPPEHMGYGIVDANNAVFTNRYEFEQSHYTAQIGEGQTHTQTLDVPSGTEEFVAAIAWNDRQGIPATGGSRIIKNDLDFTAVGPSGQRIERLHDSNLKRIVIEDPEPGTWEIEVHGHRIIKDAKWQGADHPDNLVRFDVVYRTVRDDPTLSVNTPDHILLQPDEGDQVRFELNVTGTGAPVSNIYTRAIGRNGLTHCGDTENRDGNVVGMLSRDFSDVRTMCYDVPDAYGTYPVDIWINSTNADRPVIERTVVIERRPNVSLDPFTRETVPNGTETYRVEIEGETDSLASVDLVFEFEEPPVGEFLAVNPLRSHDTSSSSTTITPDGDLLRMQFEDVQLSGAFAQDIAEITVQGTQTGSTNITVDIVEIRNASTDPAGRFTGTGTQYVGGELLVGLGTYQPDGSVPGNATVGDPIQVEIESGGGGDGTVPGITIQDVVWDFGDGSTAGGPSASHTYDEPGEYNVTVTVVTPECLVAQRSWTVEVLPDDPSARLHAQLEPLVADFNQNVASSGGGRILGMVSGETVEARIQMNSGETAFLTIRFGSGGQIQDFAPGAPASPTMRMTTTEPVIRRVMNAPNPAVAFRQAFDSGEVSINGVGVVNTVVVEFGKIVYDVGRTISRVVGDFFLLPPVGSLGR